MKVYSQCIVSLDECVNKVMEIENGKIVALYDKKQDETVDVDASNYRVLPGIIDTHNHGTMGYSLMGECDDKQAEVRGYLKGLASQGVTSALPTADISYFNAIAEVAKTRIDGASVAGIHSEGPYLNRVGEKGVDTGHPDIDLNHLKDMVDQAQGYLKLVAIAPELDGAKDAISYLTSKGVRCAYAHSNCNYNEALESFKWGITVTTHTANVMSGIHHRNMGGLGACLLNDEVYNELICDGLHVTNEMIELMFRVKHDAFNKFMMVSDNVPMAGAPVGRYNLPGMFEVNIDEKGYCLSDTGRLCGSTMPVIKGIKNLYENLNLSLPTICKMSSFNPAKVYGLAGKGALSVGYDADFTIVDKDFNVIQTYSEGRLVYDVNIDKEVFNPNFLNKIK